MLSASVNKHVLWSSLGKVHVGKSFSENQVRKTNSVNHPLVVWQTFFQCLFSSQMKHCIQIQNDGDVESWWWWCIYDYGDAVYDCYGGNYNDICDGYDGYNRIDAYDGKSGDDNDIFDDNDRDDDNVKMMVTMIGAITQIYDGAWWLCPIVWLQWSYSFSLMMIIITMSMMIFMMMEGDSVPLSSSSDCTFISLIISVSCHISIRLLSHFYLISVIFVLYLDHILIIYSFETCLMWPWCVMIVTSQVTPVVNNHCSAFINITIDIIVSIIISWIISIFSISIIIFSSTRIRVLMKCFLVGSRYVSSYDLHRATRQIWSSHTFS